MKYHSQKSEDLSEQSDALSSAAPSQDVEQLLVVQAQIDALTHQIEDCRARTQVIDKSESDLMLSVEDVFRRTIADIEEEGHQLLVRLTPAYKPISKPQDVEFPLPSRLQYRNYLCAVQETKQSVQYNFSLYDGATSATQADTLLSEAPIGRQAAASVRKVKLWYDPHMALLRGIQLFNGEDEKVFQTGCPFGNQFKS